MKYKHRYEIFSEYILYVCVLYIHKNIHEENSTNYI